MKPLCFSKFLLLNAVSSRLPDGDSSMMLELLIMLPALGLCLRSLYACKSASLFWLRSILFYSCSLLNVRYVRYESRCSSALESLALSLRG